MELAETGDGDRRGSSRGCRSSSGDAAAEQATCRSSSAHGLSLDSGSSGKREVVKLPQRDARASNRYGRVAWWFITKLEIFRGLEMAGT